MRRKHSGFTLVELMIVVLVLAVLALVAIPNFRIIIDKNRIRDATGPLFTAMSLARTEAIKLASVVDLCTRNDAGTDCDLNNDWDRDGWIALEDDGGTITVIRLQPDADPKVSVAVGDDLAKISYQPSGLARFFDDSDTLIPAGDQTFTWNSECWTQTITVSPTGKPTIGDPIFKTADCG